MTPYLEILNAVVDRLAQNDPFGTPVVVPVFPEYDEPDPARPGQGEQLDNLVEAALQKAGVAAIVYCESVELNEQNADVLEIRVQIAENVVNNRHTSGSQKPNLTLCHCARSLLQGWQSPALPQWTPFLFLGINTIDKGPVLIREVRLITMTLMDVSLWGQDPPDLSAPDIVSGTPGDYIAGEAYSFQLTATGAGTVTWDIVSGSLPPGVSLNASTGLVSGTPTEDGLGAQEWPVQYRATTVFGSTNTASFALHVLGRCYWGNWSGSVPAEFTEANVTADLQNGDAPPPLDVLHYSLKDASFAFPASTSATRAMLAVPYNLVYPANAAWVWNSLRGTDHELIALNPSPNTAYQGELLFANGVRYSIFIVTTGGTDATEWAPRNAFTEDHNYAGSLQNIPWTATPTVPQFNPTTGTLAKVYFTGSMQWTGGIWFENLDSVGHTVIATTTSSMFWLLDGSPLFNLSTSSGLTKALALYDGDTDYIGASGWQQPTNSKANQDPRMFTDADAEWSYFSGTGSLPLALSATHLRTATGSPSIDKAGPSQSAFGYNLSYLYYT